MDHGIRKSDKNNTATVNALKEHGYDINRERNKSVGKYNLKKVDDIQLYNSYTGTAEEGSQTKAKKGVRVVNKIGGEKFSSDILLLTKKIANSINALIPPPYDYTEIRFALSTASTKFPSSQAQKSGVLVRS